MAEKWIAALIHITGSQFVLDHPSTAVNRVFDHNETPSFNATVVMSEEIENPEAYMKERGAETEIDGRTLIRGGNQST